MSRWPSRRQKTPVAAGLQRREVEASASVSREFLKVGSEQKAQGNSAARHGKVATRVPQNIACEIITSPRGQKPQPIAKVQAL